MKVIVKATGIKEVDEALKNLEPKLSKKILRQAFRKALKPALIASKQLVPVRSGLLKKNLKIRSGPRSRRNISMVIGTSAKGFTGSKQYYGSFVEWGHNARGGRANKADTGNKKTSGIKLAGKPFMKIARDLTADIVAGVARNEIINGLKRAEATKTVLEGL